MGRFGTKEFIKQFTMYCMAKIEFISQGILEKMYKRTFVVN